MIYLISTHDLPILSDFWYNGGNDVLKKGKKRWGKEGGRGE
jgi:4-alpha-glucanotransferase